MALSCVIMKLLLSYYGFIMALSWRHYGVTMNITELLWSYYDLLCVTMALSWRYYGIIMVLLWSYCGVMRYYGATMRYYVVIHCDPSLISAISWPYSVLSCLYPGAILRYPALHVAQHDID